MGTPESSDINSSWIDSHPIAFFMYLVASGVVAGLIYSFVLNQPLSKGLLYGITFGVTSATLNSVFGD